MREMDRLIASLFPDHGEASGPKLLDLKFFPGSEKVTVEEFCSDVLAAFILVDSGRTNATETYPEDQHRASLNRFLQAA